MKPIIAIVGPTAVGKTKLSLALAETMHSEIISCDSMQFYRELEIGTAKIKTEEMQGIKHHLIDILDPDQEFSVVQYQEIVRKKIAEMHRANLVPILVGGSGLFISSVLYNYRFLGDQRKGEYDRNYEDYTTAELAELLKELSPQLAERTDLKNRRRVLRALEKSDEELDQSGSELYYKNAIVIGLDMDRDLLYERINQRVDQMIADGLLEEARGLFEKYGKTQSSMAIGYKELYQYFAEKISLDQAIELIKKNSRHYAKRQLTWFRNKLDCFWLEVDPDNFHKTIQEAIQISKYL